MADLPSVHVSPPRRPTRVIFGLPATSPFSSWSAGCNYRLDAPRVACNNNTSSDSNALHVKAVPQHFRNPKMRHPPQPPLFFLAFFSTQCRHDPSIFRNIANKWVVD
ncbi:uncharacterized protein SETTUDRAFT_164747 [Exserohilum turcica Et28A]|uniref:Uncharacterized protein n=1 Tax=Exserohilum turcicum (strain 28A) TaxID=671987 RepID=R0JQ62_EXST2|nr:uncharacterized protein SETTUDRAFT_164747 [Exserohilum turcica Et28A]EOA83323.1 hypothetical protein SETTUDRAFT_164747 [Exserohilum turcica Et28A]